MDLEEYKWEEGSGFSGQFRKCVPSMGKRREDGCRRGNQWHNIGDREAIWLDTVMDKHGGIWLYRAMQVITRNLSWMKWRRWRQHKDSKKALTWSDGQAKTTVLGAVFCWLELGDMGTREINGENVTLIKTVDDEDLYKSFSCLARRIVQILKHLESIYPLF